MASIGLTVVGKAQRSSIHAVSYGRTQVVNMAQAHLHLLEGWLHCGDQTQSGDGQSSRAVITNSAAERVPISPDNYHKSETA